MSADEQNKLVADYIMFHVPGEPSKDEGAGACAVRLLITYRAALTKIMNELGVPDKSYPAPVANAHKVAKYALGVEKI